MKKKYEKVLARFQIYIILFMVIVFTVFWVLYYNDYMFHTLRLNGAIISVSIFIIIYASMGKLYRAFVIGVYQMGETAFSQISAVLFADAILYIQCCLVYKQFLDIRPMLCAFGIQFVGAILWAYYSKNYYISRVSPDNTIIIKGNDDRYVDLYQKLNRQYTHLFEMNKEITEEEIRKNGTGILEEYTTIILYEVEEKVRKEIIQFCISEKKNLYLTPSIENLMFQGFEPRHYVDTPLLCYNARRNVSIEPIWKRLFDVILALICLILFSPFMIITIIAIKLEDGGKVFFTQKRCTKNGKVFEMIKFRSMIEKAEKKGEVIPYTDNDSRVTKCGKIIRRYRIDEMPQFINILKGDMSIVGPRPERIEHVEAYTKEMKEFSYRLSVKGGLTGYAQVYGKYNTTPKDKLKLDLMYIQNPSLLKDLKIILLTLKTIVYSNGTDGFESKKKLKLTNAEQKKT